MNRIMRKFIKEKILADKLAVVVGAGRSGLAAARLLCVLGATVRVVDANDTLDPSIVNDIAGDIELQTGRHSPAQFADADIVVLSPGVPVKRLEPFLKDVPARKIVAELELASWFIEAPVLAVTGSNGKTTTTTLISEILEKSGLRAFTGGNIGTPLCEYLLDMEPVDVIVLEVSSFQLQNCRLFKPHVGLFLNLAPNHLDYHEDMEEYLHAKLNLFAHMNESDAALLHESLRPVLEGRDITRARMEWFGPTDRFEAPHLLGEHNRSNVEAAWQAVRRFGVTEEQAAEAIREFKPLAHRIEPVGEKGDVLFVDDSKATTLEAVVAAVRSFDRPVRLLMGGVFKGGDVAALARDVKDHVRSVALFGASREVFEPELAKLFPVSWDATLDLAVKRLYADANPGDVILLSPGTSSFDLYSGYAQRGNHFQSVVEELA